MRHVGGVGVNLNALWVRLAPRPLDALVLNMGESGKGGCCTGRAWITLDESCVTSNQVHTGCVRARLSLGAFRGGAKVRCTLRYMGGPRWMC